jgi:hypothetical protein
VRDSVVEGSGDTELSLNMYNNTVYDKYGIYLRSISGYPSRISKSTVRIKNNAFYNRLTTGTAAAGVVIHDNNSLPTELDYNHYFNQRSDRGVVLFSYKSNDLKTIGRLAAENGYEVNGSFGDPLFVDVSPGLGSYSNLNNLRLKSGSPLIGSAVNASHLTAFDFENRTRAGWDKGAFSFLNIGPKTPTIIDVR